MKKHNRASNFYLGLLLILATIGCSSNATTPPVPDQSVRSPSASEMAITALSSAINATENSPGVAQTNPAHLMSTPPPCPTTTLVCGTSANSSMEFDFGSCTLLAFTFNGSINVNFNEALSCSAITGPISALPAGAAVTRVMNLAVYFPPDGLNIIVRSATSGWSIPVGGGSSVVCGAGGCGASRTVTLLGDRWQAFEKLQELFDFTISSTPITVTSTGSSRQVSSGTITVQGNMNQYIATATINGPLTTSAQCCYPTTGSVTTSYELSGSTINTETLTFGPTCGKATLVGTATASTAVTLSNCF